MQKNQQIVAISMKETLQIRWESGNSIKPPYLVEITKEMW